MKSSLVFDCKPLADTFDIEIDPNDRYIYLDQEDLKYVGKVTSVNKPGYFHTEETILRMKEAAKKRGVPRLTTLLGAMARKGKPLPEAQKEKMLQKRVRVWEVTTPDNQILVISNMKRYCQENNLNKGHMTSVAKGKLPSHKGYICKKLGSQNVT